MCYWDEKIEQNLSNKKVTTTKEDPSVLITKLGPNSIAQMKKAVFILKMTSRSLWTRIENFDLEIIKKHTYLKLPKSYQLQQGPLMMWFFFACCLRAVHYLADCCGSMHWKKNIIYNSRCMYWQNVKPKQSNYIFRNQNKLLYTANHLLLRNQIDLTCKTNFESKFSILEHCAGAICRNIRREPNASTAASQIQEKET